MVSFYATIWRSCRYRIVRLIRNLRHAAFVPFLFVVASAGALVQASPALRTATPFQTRSTSLVEGTPVASLDFRLQNGLISIPVRINGSRELRLYLDTGMSAPVVVLFHRETAAEIGLKETGKAGIGGAGGEARRPASLAAGATVEAGGLRLTGQTVITMDESRDGSPWPVDGIVGKSFFDRYVTEIDFEGSRLSFHDPARAKVGEGATSMPIDLVNGYPVFEAAVRIRREGEALPLRMVMDLGHRNALSLNQDAARGVLPPERTVETIGGRGTDRDGWPRLSLRPRQ